MIKTSRAASRSSGDPPGLRGKRRPRTIRNAPKHVLMVMGRVA